MLQLANFVPVLVSGLIVGVLVEKTGKRMYFALIGTLLVILGHVLYIVTPGCKTEQCKGLFECPGMWWPPLVASLGYGIYAPVLLSSLSYMAINQVQGLAYAFAFCFINFFSAVWLLIQDIIIPLDSIDLNSKPDQLFTKNFDEAHEYLHKTSALYLGAACASFGFIIIAYAVDFK